MAKKEAPVTFELVCKKCGAEVSGPDEKSVKDAMARHAQAHPARKK